jgi:branched-chain amino acid transport system ATP-binding protein
MALELSDLVAGYGRSTAIRGVSLEVSAGGVVAVLGANGVGKTTTLRVASGLLRPKAGRVTVNGVDVTQEAPHARARAGVCLIPEGRGIFRSLSIVDNLKLQIPPWAERGAGYERAIEAFPVLGQRLHQQAGSLSGGEQQMLALSRAYLAEPSVVLVDEVSMGLSPALVDQIFETLADLASKGVALVIVEQYVGRALAIADTVVLLDKGEVTFSGPASEVDESALLQNYLGTGQ